MPALHHACLLLGSNIQPEKNLGLGMALLRRKVQVLRISSVWETPAVGSDGPNYLNMAVLIRTQADAGELKEKILRPLEARLGRVRGPDKNAPRPIDMDIIVFDDEVLDPNLWRYAHRAVPVAEIMPVIRSSQGETLEQVASDLARTTPIRMIADAPAAGRSHAA